MPLRLLSRYALAVLFVLAGAWHFVHPATYLAIMPPWLPQPLALVYASGAFEILGGLGLLLRGMRRAAGWGLLALLVAVFPANVYMALIHEQLGIPGWVAWGRLPLQLPLLWWVWNSALNEQSNMSNAMSVVLSAAKDLIKVEQLVLPPTGAEVRRFFAALRMTDIALLILHSSFLIKRSVLTPSARPASVAARCAGRGTRSAPPCSRR